MNEVLARLKQRKLVQWSLAYIAAAFALIQVVDVVADSYGWPHLVMHLVFGVLVVGFVVTLVLAWYHGERGAQRISGPELLLIALALALAIGGGLLWHFGRAGSTAAVPVKAAANGRTAEGASAAPASAISTLAPQPKTSDTFDPPKGTLVVLPFTDLGSDPKQQYFSDGITEELTGALGQNAALHVIAWDTASKYRGSAQSATDIGRALNVADVVHGSIEREGSEVRISAELVDARTGYELWSQHYDDSFANIFAVQDRVTQSIASAMKVKFAQGDLPASGTENPEAHDLVLKGRELMNKYDAASLEAARKDFEQAIKLDDNYADAHALLADVLFRLTERSDLSLKQTLPLVRAEADKALTLDPRNAEARVALGNADGSADPPQRAKAQDEYRKVLALDPNDAGAHLDYALTLPIKPALDEFRKAAQLDPDSTVAQYNLAFVYLDLGKWTQSIEAAEALVRLDPQDVDGAFLIAYARQRLHQYEQMVAAFDLVKPATPLDRQQVDTGRQVYRAVANSTLRPQALAAIADLSRHQSNKDVAGNLVPMYASLGEYAKLLQLLENVCPGYTAFCTDLAANPWYAPLRNNPRFQRLVKKYSAIKLDDPLAAASNGATP
ncbi:MAG TPA: tetratricopeptide repeat protein [Rhodanobacteraceae bacterium]|nr:tetratricopeptide repeat protein [Rhodanobacteraceae bacterium]